jgi:dTDP-L-rhamnose 4-epimerase
MSKHILITGGAGFIGRHLAHRMLTEGFEVTIYDIFSPQIHGGASPQVVLGELWRACRVIQGDVRDRDALGKALADQTVVVHLAAETGTGQSMYEVERYVDVNSRGTAVLLDLVANGVKGIERMVVASSRAVYGEGRYECPEHGIVYPRPRKKTDMDRGDFAVKCPICDAPSSELATDESSKLHPTSIYGITKLNQEQMVLVESEALGIPGVALRYQNVYGPGQSLNNPYTGILSIFSRLLQAGNEINIFEDGMESRDFVYIDDVVEATFRAIQGGETATGAFNVGTGTKTTVHQVALTLKEIYGSSSPLRVSGNYRLGDIRHNFAELNHVQARLDFVPRVSFAEGIRAFSKWVLSQAQGATGGLAYERSIQELRARGLMK